MFDISHKIIIKMGCCSNLLGFFGFNHIDVDGEHVLDVQYSFFRLYKRPNGLRGFLLLIGVFLIASIATVAVEKAHFDNVCSKGNFPLDTEPDCHTKWIMNGMSLVSVGVLTYLLMTFLNASIYKRVDTFEKLPVSILAGWLLYSLLLPYTSLTLLIYFHYFRGAGHPVEIQLAKIFAYVIILLLAIAGFNCARIQHVMFSSAVLASYMYFVSVLTRLDIWVFDQMKTMTRGEIFSAMILALTANIVIHLFWVFVHHLKLKGEGGTLMTKKMMSIPPTATVVVAETTPPNNV